MSFFFNVNKFFLQKSFFNLFIILFSILLLYDSYCLKKQIENLNLANLQLQTDLGLINSKCVEISESINCLTQKNVLSDSTKFLVDFVPSLSTEGFYSLGAILVVTFIAGGSGWIAGKFLYSSYITKSSYFIFFKTLAYTSSYSQFIITTKKHYISSTIIFSTPPVTGHLIKPVAEAHAHYIPLADFLNKLVLNTDSTIASEILLNTPIF